MAENKTLEHLPEVRAAVTVLSPEDREEIVGLARRYLETFLGKSGG